MSGSTNTKDIERWKAEMTDPKTITIREASDMMDISKSRVFQLIDAAGIVKHRVGNRCMVALSDIVELRDRRDAAMWERIRKDRLRTKTNPAL